MKTIRTALETLASFCPRSRGGTLGAALLFFALITLPRESCALISYGAEYSYQQNSSTSSGAPSSSSFQNKFNFNLTINSKPLSLVTLSGDFNVDVLTSGFTGSEATSIQPNLLLRLNTKSMQSSVGYRLTLRDDSIIAGNQAQTTTSNGKELFIDNTLRVSNLPELRLRYANRDLSQDTNGLPISSSNTREFAASMSYKLGIFTMNADYSDNLTKDTLTRGESGATSFVSQLTMTRNIGRFTNLTLRENLTYNKATTNGAVSAETSQNVAEAKTQSTPVTGLALGGDYVYRTATDILLNKGSTTESTIVGSANYAMKKFFRFYVISVAVNRDNPDNSAAKQASTVMGVAFTHRAGIFSVTSRFERTDNTSESTDATGVKTPSDSARSNFDLALAAAPSQYLKMDISESYVASTDQGKDTSQNLVRLRADIGPVKNLNATPSLDYTVATAADGSRTTTSQFNAPLRFHLELHDKASFNLEDTYSRQSSTPATGDTVTTSSNNAIFRLSLLRPLPNTVISADAAFSTTYGQTQKTTTSSYNLNVGWTDSPHTLNGTFKYQPGVANANSSYGASFRYGLALRLKKLALNLQAAYSYDLSTGLTTSSSQSVNFVLRIRK